MKYCTMIKEVKYWRFFTLYVQLVTLSSDEREIESAERKPG